MSKKVCPVCVMDETCQPFSILEGVGCNHCQAARERRQSSNQNTDDLAQVLAEIKADNKTYDCVVGVSGGLDSSYLLAKAKEFGLKPLAVHMDNNWNSSVASHNLRQLLEKLDVPLITVVTDWNTQRSIQRALIDSDVVDIELLYDNALHAVCYGVARKMGIKVILGGANLATEGVEVPTSWVWRKFDGSNIRAIARKYGASTKQFPIYSSWLWLWDTVILRIKWISLLDLLGSYGRHEALNYLRSNYGYVPYGQKHFENVFTRFYQGYILPVKFGIDKRKPHLSSEIVDGKISRSEALIVLNKPIYSSDALLRLDNDYVLDKLGISQSKMDDYLSRMPKRHQAYKHEKYVATFISILLRLRRRLLALKPRPNLSPND